MQRREKILLSLFVIVVLVTYIFLPCIKNDFLNYDDPDYILKNSSVHKLSLENLKAIFSKDTTGLYQPLVNISYLIEYHFYGLNPAVYHATNVILHVLNACLVFWFILVLDGSILASFLTALLFGIHPLRVESVAWITERKDVLYSFFYLLALINYCKYLKNNYSSKHYYRSLFLFLLSLGSKAMAVTLPLIFFVIDYLLGRKFTKKTFLEKLPFFILTLLFCIIAVLAQGKYFDTQGQSSPITITRIIYTPFYNIAMYLFSIVYPFKLSLIYLYPPRDLSFFIVYAFSIILFCLIVWIVWRYRKHTRKLGFGFVFALITILPALQLIPNTFTIRADRYTYIPSIGIFYILSVGFLYLYFKKESGIRIKLFLVLIAIGVVTILSILTYQRTFVWKNSNSIFSDVIKKYPKCHVGYNNRSLDYAHSHEFKKAIADCTKAYELEPTYSGAYNNCGSYEIELGKFEEAKTLLNKALEIKPDYAEAYFNLGLLSIKQNNFSEAIVNYSKAIQYMVYPRPDFYFRRGLAYFKQGEIIKAINDYNKAIEIRPDYVDAHINRGLAYSQARMFHQAIDDYNKVLELSPNSSDVYNYRGIVFSQQGRSSEAISDFTMAIGFNPNFTDAYNNRGILYGANNFPLALSDFNKALKINPRAEKIYNSRAAIYYLMKDYDKSWVDVHKAQDLGYKVDPGFLNKLKNESGKDN